MKKTLMWLRDILSKAVFAVMMIVAFVVPAFASAGVTEIAKALWANIGWLAVAYIVFRVAIWVIRATKTQVDDKIIDNYISVAVKYALNLIPQNTKVNWLKFVGNALGKFNEAYTKEQGDSPDMTVLDKAKKIIEETADEIEFKDIKTVLEQYKDNKEVA